MFVVSKVYPHNAGRKSAISACERSLKRLGTDRLDLYLLHWRGRIPLAETVDAFERLRADGQDRRAGACPISTPPDMRELYALPDGRRCATNQVLYHLGERGIEWELLPWMREQAIPVWRIRRSGRASCCASATWRRSRKELATTPAQLALRWVLRAPGVIAIPESANPDHVRANRNAVSLALDDADARRPRRGFPAAAGPTPLAVI